jgi:hypothetical protein
MKILYTSDELGLVPRTDLLTCSKQEAVKDVWRENGCQSSESGSHFNDMSVQISAPTLS